MAPKAAMMRRGPFRQPVWRWLVPLTAVWGLACSSGSGLNPVEGKVVFKNGPVKGALVTFHLKGADPIKTLRPTGLTDENGIFTLSTGDKEGATAGEYVVTLVRPVTLRSKKTFSTAPPEGGDAFDGAYADPRKSVLKAEVKRGVNKLEPFILK